MVADRQRHAAYHNKQYSDKLFIGVNIDDFEWPWIFKIWVLVFFSNLWLRRRFQEWIASKWIELNQDNLRIGTAKAVARLMSFAQITCHITAGDLVCCIWDSWTPVYWRRSVCHLVTMTLCWLWVMRNWSVVLTRPLPSWSQRQRTRPSRQTAASHNDWVSLIRNWRTYSLFHNDQIAITACLCDRQTERRRETRVATGPWKSLKKIFIF